MALRTSRSRADSLALIGGSGCLVVGFWSLVETSVGRQGVIKPAELFGWGILAISMVASLSVAASIVIDDRSKRENLGGIGLVALLLISGLTFQGFGLRILPFVGLVAWSFLLHRSQSRRPRAGAKR